MSEIKSDSPGQEVPATQEEILSALFAHMVIQQTNMSMMLLGKVAHPQTGKIVQDIESAKLLIDQLEMLEIKTKGNLSVDEADLLKQALTALRMAFVETASAAEPSDKIDSTPEELAKTSSTSTPAQPTPPFSADASKEAPDDSKKRFSKKY